MTAFKDLDPLLHSQLRLAVMSLLSGLEFAEFNYLLEETGATKGNLSVQLKKLEEAGYIEIKKTFRDNYPLTRAFITKKGSDAFLAYAEALKSYLNKK